MSEIGGDEPVKLVDGGLPKGFFAMFCLDSFYLERTGTSKQRCLFAVVINIGWRTVSISFGMSSAKRSLSVWGFVEANLRDTNAARARGERTWIIKNDGMSLLAAEQRKQDALGT